MSGSFQQQTICIPLTPPSPNAIQNIYHITYILQVDHTSNLDSSTINISDINIYWSPSLNGDITDNLQYQIWVGEDYEDPSNDDTNIFDVVNVTLVSDEVSMSVHMSINQQFV